MFLLKKYIEENNDYEFDKFLVLMDSFAYQHFILSFPTDLFKKISNWQGVTSKKNNELIYKGHKILLEDKE